MCILGYFPLTTTYYIFSVHICLFICVCRGVCEYHSMYIEVRGQSVELVLSLYHVDSRDGIEVMSAWCQVLLFLSHSASLMFSL